MTPRPSPLSHNGEPRPSAGLQPARAAPICAMPPPACLRVSDLQGLVGAAGMAEREHGFGMREASRGPGRRHASQHSCGHHRSTRGMGVEASGQPRWEQRLEEKLQGGDKSQRRAGQPALTSNTCDEGSGIPGHLCSKKREIQLQEASPTRVGLRMNEGPQ